MQKYFCDKCGKEIHSGEARIYVNIGYKVRDSRPNVIAGERCISEPVETNDKYAICISCFDENLDEKFPTYSLRKAIRNFLGWIKSEEN